MSDKEIKDLAREYAQQNPPQGIKDAILRENAISLNAQIFEKHLQWLSSRYCIVEKEIIRKEYKEAKSTYNLYTSATCINDMESRAIDHSHGRIYELTTLFGKELFSDTEQ